MLKSFKSVLSGQAENSAGYQAVSVGDEAEEERQESGKRHERKVYYCFWALGAGVLLSWNGEWFMPHVQFTTCKARWT